MSNTTGQSEFEVANVITGLPIGKAVPGEVVMALDLNGNPQAVSENTPLMVADAYQPPLVANWTSATTINTAAVIQTAGMDCVALTIIPGGTITAGAITFEVYDGFNWFAIKSARESSYNTDSVFSLVGATQQAWTIPVAAYPQFRYRLSTALTGTAPTAVITTISSSAPDTSVVTAGLDPLQAGHPGIVTMQAEQIVTVGAASAASAAVQATTNRVVLSSTTGAWVAFGSNPTAVAATTGNIYVPPNVVMPAIAVTPGITKIAAIQATAGGTLSIIESL